MGCLLVPKLPQKQSQRSKIQKIFWGGMPPDPPSNALLHALTFSLLGPRKYFFCKTCLLLFASCFHAVYVSLIVQRILSKL